MMRALNSIIPCGYSNKAYTKSASECFLAMALYDGVEDGNLKQLTTLLLNKGANPNIVLSEFGIAPIHLSSGLEDKHFGYEATKLFLSHGGDPNVRSSDGLTPVHICSMWGRNLVLQLLLDNGGDPWLTDNENKNAFCHAHDEQQWKTFKLLDSFKNVYLLQKPDNCNKKFKLQLDRVKVFNDDLCAEYLAVPLKSKCRSSQSQPVISEKGSSLASNVQLTKELPDKARKKTVYINNNYNFTSPPLEGENLQDDDDDDMFHKAFGSYPNKQELRALEMIRKHRKGITVYEYQPESGCRGEDDCSSNYQNRIGRRSILNVGSESLSTLVRGSLFADVKSKLELFYKSKISNSNQDCTWRVNIIQKKKEKEQLKIEESRRDLEQNSGCSSELGNCVESKVLPGTRHKTKRSNTFDDTISSSEFNKNTKNVKPFTKKSEKSRRKKICKKVKKPACDSHNDAEDQKLRTFHHLEDITDSYNCDSDSQTSLASNVNSKMTGSEHCDENSSISICENIFQEILGKIDHNSHVSSTEDTDFMNMIMNSAAGDNSMVLDRTIYAAEKEENFFTVSAKVHMPKNPSVSNITSPVPVLLRNSEEIYSCGCDTVDASSSKENLQDEKTERLPDNNNSYNLKKWTCAEVISSDEENEFSIIEEYLYTDEEDGIELIEEHHLPTSCKCKVGGMENFVAAEEAVNKDQVTTESETESSLSTVDTAYETDALRKELKELGLNNGPITGGTKRIYLRQLKRAKRRPVSLPTKGGKNFSYDLKRLLISDKSLFENWSYLEKDMSKPFESPDPNKRWREGTAKTSFNYLLLDPRITQNLPYRVKSLTHKQTLTCFLESIFYVGRGKRSRPYSHLTEALSVWNRWKHACSSKINKILDIWRSGRGVVCLHIFQNVIPAEAMTREAAMIDSLGLLTLTNERVGDYYGATAMWNSRQRQQLGAVLLVRALRVLLAEGERQIRPPD